MKFNSNRRADGIRLIRNFAVYLVNGQTTKIIVPKINNEDLCCLDVIRPGYDLKVERVVLTRTFIECNGELKECYANLFDTGLKDEYINSLKSNDSIAVIEIKVGELKTDVTYNLVDTTEDIYNLYTKSLGSRQDFIRKMSEKYKILNDVTGEVRTLLDVCVVEDDPIMSAINAMNSKG